jgi:hypothetical protein
MHPLCFQCCLQILITQASILLRILPVILLNQVPILLTMFIAIFFSSVHSAYKFTSRFPFCSQCCLQSCLLVFPISFLLAYRLALSQPGFQFASFLLISLRTHSQAFNSLSILPTSLPAQVLIGPYRSLYFTVTDFDYTYG